VGKVRGGEEVLFILDILLTGLTGLLTGPYCFLFLMC
jgi:hypothetical protein